MLNHGNTVLIGSLWKCYHRCVYRQERTD